MRGERACTEEATRRARAPAPATALRLARPPARPAVDAPLERFHAATMSTLLMDAPGGTDVLAAQPLAAVKRARKMLVRVILATDMTRHIGVVEQLAERTRSGAAYRSTSDDDVDELAGAIVHCADFAGSARSLDDARGWTERLVNEFRAQAVQEAARGLPVTPFMSDLTDDIKVARLQAAFVAGIVLPLWRAAAARLTGLDEPLANLAATLAYFEEVRSKAKPLALAAADSAAADAEDAGAGAPRDEPTRSGAASSSLSGGARATTG